MAGKILGHIPGGAYKAVRRGMGKAGDTIPGAVDTGGAAINGAVQITRDPEVIQAPRPAAGEFRAAPSRPRESSPYRRNGWGIYGGRESWLAGNSGAQTI